MRAFWFAALLSSSACTAHNPQFAGSDGGGTGGGDLAGVPFDLADTRDLASRDLAGGLCAGGMRTCSATNLASEVCSAGMYVTDRACPQGSQCQNGYCQPPPLGPAPMGVSCLSNKEPSETLCLSNVTDQFACQPFVVSAGAQTISWVCAPHVGAGLPGVACAKGTDCRSGFCGSNGTCFRGCTVTTDCPANRNLRCLPVDLVVEGVKTTATGCI